MLTTQQKTGLNILQVSTFFRPPCHILSDQPGAAGQALWELLWRTEAVTFQLRPARLPLPPSLFSPEKHPTGLHGGMAGWRLELGASTSSSPPETQVFNPLACSAHHPPVLFVPRLPGAVAPLAFQVGSAPVLGGPPWPCKGTSRRWQAEGSGQSHSLNVDVTTWPVGPASCVGEFRERERKVGRPFSGSHGESSLLPNGTEWLFTVASCLGRGVSHPWWCGQLARNTPFPSRSPPVSHLPVPATLVVTLGTHCQVTGPEKADQSPKAQLSAEPTRGKAQKLCPRVRRKGYLCGSQVEGSGWEVPPVCTERVPTRGRGCGLMV